MYSRKFELPQKVNYHFKIIFKIFSLQIRVQRALIHQIVSTGTGDIAFSIIKICTKTHEIVNIESKKMFQLICMFKYTYLSTTYLGN